MNFSNMTIGVPKEIMRGERRVALNPQTAKKIIDNGGTVIMETNAGLGALLPDEMYLEAGVIIKDNAKEVFDNADLILKVKEPKFNEEFNMHEVDMLKEGQVLITFLHPATTSNHDMVRNLANNGITSFTLDGIPRITRAQSMDALTSMSTVAGYKGVIMAANELPYFIPMMSTAVGMVKPANVLVVGVGVAGLQAVATAKRLGAVVHSVDIRPDASEQGRSLGAKEIELNIPEELAVGEGGYAKALPEEWLEKERATLLEYVKDMNLVVLSALIPSRRAPILLKEEAINAMKPGSVVVDISIDQGGNCELTQAGEVIVHNHVTIMGINNIPGLMPQSSTEMFAQNVFNYINYLYKDGKLTIDRDDDIVRESLVTFDKSIVHEGTLEAMEG